MTTTDRIFISFFLTLLFLNSLYQTKIAYDTASMTEVLLAIQSEQRDALNCIAWPDQPACL